MPSTRLLKRDWEKDHVYLVQFPRAGCIPTPSPFALKVETWLRMTDIPYTNIDNEFTKMSTKGQIPFIEVNGRQVADSNFIIDHLIEVFHKDAACVERIPVSIKQINTCGVTNSSVLVQNYHFALNRVYPLFRTRPAQYCRSALCGLSNDVVLISLSIMFFFRGIDDRLTPMEKSYARAYHALVEDSFRWVLIYQRGRDNKWFATDQGFLPHFSGIKKFAFKNVMCERLRKRIANLAHTQGIGRNTPEEVVILAKKDIDAISMFLGNKKFFFGEKPTTLDCTMFAHLAQFVYTPLVTPEVKTHMEQNAPNLIAFVQRMKEAYWPDWEEATKNRSMNSKWNSK